MKRIIALLLLASTLLTSMAFAETEYEKPVKISISSCFTTVGKDYTADPLARYFLDKFNMEMDVWINDNSTHDSTTRTWINGGTMPDVCQWMSYNPSELDDWVDQGLIAPLPEGWEEKYPNLYRNSLVTGLYEQMKYDEITYAIPHSAFCNFVEFEALPYHQVVFYRKDWADKLGAAFSGKDTVTMSQLEQFALDCKKANFDGVPNLAGVTAYSSAVYEMFAPFLGFRVDMYKDDENNRYVFGCEAGAEKIEALLSLLRGWYQQGALDPDFLIMDANTATTKFSSGKAAAYVAGGNVHHYVSMYDVYQTTYPDRNAQDCIASAVLTNDDGEVWSHETPNYWTATVFNPSISQEQLDRVLALMDYCCTKEGEIIVEMGLKDVDWTYDQDGRILSLTGSSSVEKYDSFYIYAFLSILSDDISLVSPAYSQNIRDTVNNAYKIKCAGSIVPLDWDYIFYSSPAKNNCSIDILSKMNALIVGQDDIKTSWNQFLDENRPLYEPLVKELTDAFK